MSPAKTGTDVESLQIRVTQDGASVHIRCDAYRGEERIGFSASREHGALNLGNWSASVTRAVVQALEGVFTQNPLF